MNQHKAKPLTAFVLNGKQPICKEDNVTDMERNDISSGQKHYPNDDVTLLLRVTAGM